MTDPVNHPAHYTEHPSGVECIQITEHMGFNLGNAVKYIWRADLKGSAIQDLEKARWYIDRELVKRGVATEPAEERCQSVSIFRERCALVPGHDGRHAANGCAWGQAPAPAEPAEEVKPVKFPKMTAKYATANFGFPDVTDPFTRWAYKDSDGDKWAWNGDQWELHVVLPDSAEERLARNPETLARIKSALASTDGDTEVTGQDFLDAMPAEPDCWDVCEGHPAPAEPAEEETKAEVVQDIEVMQWDGTRKSIQAICDWVNSFDHELDYPTISYCFSSAAPDDVLDVSLATNEGDFVRVSDGDFIVRDTQGNFYRRDRNAYATVADASPVVPAPTETGPWQRIEDVPEGVLQIKDRHGRTWLMVGGTWSFEWHDGNWYESHTNINAQAPFVAAAEEG